MDRPDSPPPGPTAESTRPGDADGVPSPGPALGLASRLDPAYWKWAAEHELDTTQIEREGEAATVYWVKPWSWTIGAGLAGAALFVGQIWFGPLSARLGLHLGDALPWLRFGAMLVGGFLVITAWPTQITRDRVPANPEDDPLPADHEPLKTKYFE